MEDFNLKPNSNRYKEEQKQAALPEKRAEKVVTGRVITKKRGVKNLAREFISEDAPNIGSYLLKDVLIPNIKKVLSDMTKDGIDILLYGEPRNGGKRSTADRVSYTPYSNYSSRDRVRSDRPVTTAYSYDDIVLTTRGEAEDVLSRMDEIVDTYGLVRVADLFDLVGISTRNPQDNKYGWVNIRSARVERVREGYAIVLPRAMPLD